MSKNACIEQVEARVGLPQRKGLPRRLGRVILVLLLAWPALAQAHARLVHSSPADGAQLAQAPGQLELWFNERLEPEFNTVRIVPEANQPQRASLREPKPALDPKDPTHLTVPLNRLPPGQYVVEWRVLSQDGHSAPGRFTFRVLPVK